MKSICKVCGSPVYHDSMTKPKYCSERCKNIARGVSVGYRPYEALKGNCGAVEAIANEAAENKISYGEYVAVKARARTYEQGFKDGSNAALEYINNIYLLIIEDKLDLNNDQKRTIHNALDTYIYNVLNGEISFEEIREMRKEVQE